MIHSARPTVSSVGNNVCFILLDFEKGDGRTDGRTDGPTTCAKTIIPTGRDFGLAEWINLNYLLSVKLPIFGVFGNNRSLESTIKN